MWYTNHHSFPDSETTLSIRSSLLWERAPFGGIQPPRGVNHIDSSICFYEHYMLARLTSRSGANQIVGGAADSLLDSAAKSLLVRTRKATQASLCFGKPSHCEWFKLLRALTSRGYSAQGL